MTKKEIVKTISDETGLNQQQIKQIVQKTFDSIIATLVEEGRIELRNFGVFQPGSGDVTVEIVLWSNGWIVGAGIDAI